MDETTLKELFFLHYARMIRLAKTLLYDDSEAEDVVGDVFLRLAERQRASGDAPDAATIAPAIDTDKTQAYLMAAVRNGCINRIRRKSLTERARHLYSVEAEADAMRSEERIAMLDAVCDYAEQHLQEPHRTIFRLRFEQGLRLKDIASRTDMNLKTVYKYLSQSIRLVRAHFMDS